MRCPRALKPIPIDSASEKRNHNDRSSSYRFRHMSVWNLTPDSRTARDPSPASASPSGITKQYKYRCLLGTAFSFGRSRRVKSSNRVTASKLWTAISWVRSVVETRSQRQIDMQESRESFEINEFIVRCETLFVKVKSRHFHRANCEVFGQRRVRHFECQARSTSIGEGSLRYPSWIRRGLSRESYRGVEILYAQRPAHSERARADIVDCQWPLLKKISGNGFGFLQLLRQLVGNAAVLYHK